MKSSSWMSVAILAMLLGAIIQYSTKGVITPLLDLVIVILFIAQRAFTEWEEHKKKGS